MLFESNITDLMLQFLKLAKKCNRTIAKGLCTPPIVHNKRAQSDDAFQTLAEVSKFSSIFPIIYFPICQTITYCEFLPFACKSGLLSTSSPPFRLSSNSTQAPYYFFKQKLMNRSKRKAFRSYPTEQSGLCTVAPIKTPTSTRPEYSDSPHDTAKSSVLQLIQCAKLMKIFRESVSRFKGTNEPVAYRQEYEFAEKWEETNKVRHERNNNLLLSANAPCLALAILVMLAKLPLIWYLSVQQVFRLEDNMTCLLTAVLVVLVDLALKMYLLSAETSRNPQKNHSSERELAWQVAGVAVGDVVSVIGLLIKSLADQELEWQFLLDLLMMLLQCGRFFQIYNSITIILITYKYKNYVNLFGFISKMAVILHFSAILIYSATFLNATDNWLEAIQKDHEEPIVKYVYSLYFTATTMFTVGYGDVLPKNVTEIIIIILMQLFGIVLIGYIVSEIGHTLTAIRQAQEEFEHDIQNTDQVCEYYQLNEDLKQRVRNYIVNHQLANEELNINEENHFLMKLNEELRNEVKHANHLQIIKTSLFFLCNWSKKMQSELSKKLEKFIFSPNQRISSKDKLFIVTKGQIDVYIERKSGARLYLKKHLKTVQRATDKQVFSNVYGCVSLFTGRPSRLTAVSKDFAICYALDFADIIDMVKDDQKDFQYYHETRTMLELERVPEKFQVPTLINNRQHYCPTRWVVLQRHQRDLACQQQRASLFRSNRRKKKVIVEEKEPEVEESDSECILSIEEISVRDQQLHKKQEQQVARKVNNPAFVSFRSYRRKHYFRTLIEDKAREEELKRLLTNEIVRTSYFEVGKDYLRYFKKGNREAVLAKLNKNEIKDFSPINSKVMSLEWLDLIIFANKLKPQDIIDQQERNALF